MSGPTTADPIVDSEESGADAEPPCVEVTPSREALVGETTVRRALPTRGRRTVGAWCFLDHAVETLVDGGSGSGRCPDGRGMQVGPHPHIGLQTVTWLLAGEVVHRDSLGSEQEIRPGQLNLMTAGRGVAHGEETPAGYHGRLHGVQLWVAQPERTRHDEPAFAHHAELPVVEFGNASATVIVGAVGDAVSPARRDTDHVGADLVLRAGVTVVPVSRTNEHALVVLDGEVVVDDEVIAPDRLAYLGVGRDELAMTVPDHARALLVGGEPFEARPLMWWNFVARTHEEIDAAYAEWQAGGERFGSVASGLPVIPAPPPPWRSGGPEPFRPR